MRHILLFSILFLVMLHSGCRTLPESESDEAAVSARLLAGAPGTRYWAAAEPANGDVAIVVHGLFRGSRHMFKLARALAEEGYQVYGFDYESTRKEIPGHGKALREFLVAVAEAYPQARISLVTHSMGGLLARFALAHLDENAPDEWRDETAQRVLTADRFGRIVMIAPPNQGSHVARTAVRFVPYWQYLVRPLDDLSSAPESLPSHLPQITAVPTGVITARYDIAVAPGLTAYPAAADTTTIGVTHTFSVYSKRVCDATLLFLKQGSFAAAETGATTLCSKSGD